MGYTAPRDLTTYPRTAAMRLIKGEGDVPAKRIDPEHEGQNNCDMQEAVQAFRGCGGAGRLTSKTALVGSLTVTVDTGFLDAEMRIQVNDGAGGHTWEVMADADDEFTIDNAGMIYGADVADYTALAVADLYIEVVGSTNHRRMVGADGIALGDAPGGFTGDDLPRSAADATDVDAALTDIEDDLYVEHDADGTHTDDYLLNRYISTTDALANEGFVNLLNNSSFEFWNNGILRIAPDEWIAVLNVFSSIYRKDTIYYRGRYSCAINSAANGDYIAQIIPSSAEYANRTLSGSVTIKGDAGRTFSIYLWGNVSGVGTVTTAILATGDWETFYFTNTMGADTEIRLIIARNDLTDSIFYIDSADVKGGRIIKVQSLSPFDSVVLADDRLPYNFLLNPNFDHWQETNELPECWEPYAAIPDIVIDRYPDPPFGNYALSIIPNTNGQGVKQEIGNIAKLLFYFKSKTVTLSVTVSANTPGEPTYRMQVFDGIDTSYIDFDITDYPYPSRIAVTHTVNAAATGLRYAIFRNDTDLGVGAGILISNACLNIGSRPLGVVGPRPSVWTARDYVFEQNGNVVSGTILGPKQQEIMETMYPTYMSIKAVTAGAVSQSTYELQKKGAASGFILALPAGDTDAHEKQATLALVNGDIVAEDSYIDIMPTQVGGTVPQNVRVVLRGYTLAL